MEKKQSIKEEVRKQEKSWIIGLKKKFHLCTKLGICGWTKRLILSDSLTQNSE